MKKVISISLCLVLMLSALLIPASAATAELVSKPSKTTFYEGLDWIYNGSSISEKTDFDLTGTVVKHNGKNISFAMFPWGGNMIAEPSSGKWQTGKNKVKIYLEDFSGVYAESEFTLVAIKSAVLHKAPDKTELIRGTDWEYDALNNIKLKSYSPAGAQIKLTFTDNTTKVVSYSDGGMDWFVPDSIVDFAMGSNTLSLTYYGHTVPFEIRFVLEGIKSATLKNKPSLVNYEFKDNWTYSSNKIVPSYDFSGLKVSLTYTNGTSETVEYSASPKRFSISPKSTVTKGKNTMIATVDGKASVEFEIFLRSFGDVTLDGTCNSQDALTVLQYSVSLIKLNIVKFRYADVTADSKVNSSDALAILQKSVGTIEKFKAEK